MYGLVLPAFAPAPLLDRDGRRRRKAWWLKNASAEFVHIHGKQQNIFTCTLFFSVDIDVMLEEDEGTRALEEPRLGRAKEAIRLTTGVW